MALDPIPYGGATTSCEALSMGVPVITLAGKGMVGRLTASILYSANLSDYIAENLDDYVEISRKIYLKGIRNKEDKIQLKDSQ